MVKINIFSGRNDISSYIKTKIGKRFFVVKDNLCGYVGLFDLNFLDYTVMNNTDSEKEKSLEAVHKARGDVLIAGLGLGLIVLPIMNKKYVISVDVVEKYQEVIDLIKPQLPLNSKVNIIHQDIINFIPTRKYDLIYFDTIPEVQHSEEEKKARMKDGKFLRDPDLAPMFKKYLKEEGEFTSCEKNG